jgi:ABC-type transport system involved in multi-copper enzyme maturation permease subunit
MASLTLVNPQRRVASGDGYRFGNAARMEWIKLRSLRSTWWTLAFAITAAIGVGAAVGLKSKGISVDPTNNVLAGVALGLLVTGVLGVLVMSSEYGSGLIRSTLTAIPNRRLLLAAKAAVFGAVSLAIGELASFISFGAGIIGLAARHKTVPSLGDPAVLRAIVLAGAGYALIGIMGLGIGAIVRHSSAAVGVLVGVVYVLGQVIGGVWTAAMGYVPISLVANSMSTVKHVPHAPNPWVGLALLSLYAAVVLGIGSWLFTRRDA